VTSRFVVDDFVEPNGLAFSPDEKKLYVCDTGFHGRAAKNPSHIRVFDVDLASGKSFKQQSLCGKCPSPALPMGVRCDTEGRVWCSVGWGDPKRGTACAATPKRGDLLGKIHIPENRRQPVLRRPATKPTLHLWVDIALWPSYTSVQGALKP